MHEKYMHEAIKLSIKGMESGHGGPFGAVIVKDGSVVGRGFNKVLSSNDPTAHAEIIAIRKAARNLNTFDLSQCAIYTSCEPCPMCLAASYWAKIKHIFYANTKEDASKIDFNDEWIYQELKKDIKERNLLMQHLPNQKALAVFESWKRKEDKIPY